MQKTRMTGDVGDPGEGCIEEGFHYFLECLSR